LTPLSPVRFHFAGKRNIRNWHNGSARKPDRAFVEHSGIDVDRDLTAFLDDRVDGTWKSGHVIPMSVAHRDTFHIAQVNAKVRTVAEENCTFRTGVEQQG